MRTLEDITPKLIEKTRDGSISWDKGIGNDGYKTILGNYAFHVWAWEDEDGTEGISIGLRPKTDEGSFLDTIYHDKYSNKYHNLTDLHGMARRSALRLDKIIDEIDNELDNRFPF